jgi:tyrosyl-tRNA synthetase
MYSIFNMDKLQLLINNIEEIVTQEELSNILNKKKPTAYIGFEPSGSVHIGWKICTNKIKDFLACGFEFTVLLADWHAYINDKLGGDIEKIKLCGRYMEDCFASMGISKNKVKFVYASDYIRDPTYWETVLRTAKSISVARVKRAMDIMGRDAEEGEKDLSKLFYPAMQVSDIFYLDVDVAYGGMDQRRAHMLAREISKKLSRKTPVAIHTSLLTGLQAGSRMDPIEAKMSKSKPDAMLSIHDDPDIVKNKIKKAFCPEKQVEGNPVLEMCKFVIFPELKTESFLIERPDKFGGNLEFNTYNELERSYINGLHPLDLKNTVSRYINRILDPIHIYFENHPDNYNKMKKTGILSTPQK